MLATLALVSALAAATPAQAPADSVPGTWQITGDVMGNPLKVTCTLKQSGATLSGSCANDQGGPYEVTGEIKDGKITFKHGGDYQGQALTITYTATFAAPKQLKGTVDVLPFGVNGSFTAVPAPSGAPAAPAKP